MTAACRCLAIAVALLFGAHAHAQTPSSSAADAAFKEGRELYKAGKFAEACEQFDKSHRLDPAHGTLFNIAQCSERIGRLATAAAAYRELVAKDANDQRKAAAADRLKEITPRIAKVLVKIADPPSGVVVELDSKAGPRTAQPNKPIEVDLGEYTVLVRARGYNEFMSKLKIAQEGKTTTVEASLVPGASNADALGMTSSGDRGGPKRSRRKLYGYGAIALGGGAVIAGVVFGVQARSTWQDAKDVCGGTCTTQAQVDQANALGDRARSKATLATVFTIAGLAVAGGGVALWATAPKDTQITPTVSESGAGVSFSGRF